MGMSTRGTFMEKLRLLQKKLLRWFAQRPALTLVFIILFGIVLLPAVTITVLTPIALLFRYMGMFALSGSIGTVYSTVFKGVLLAFFLLGLLVIGFIMITCVSVIHSYKIFSFFSLKEKD